MTIFWLTSQSPHQCELRAQREGHHPGRGQHCLQRLPGEENLGEIIIVSPIISWCRLTPVTLTTRTATPERRTSPTSVSSERSDWKTLETILCLWTGHIYGIVVPSISGFLHNRCFNYSSLCFETILYYWEFPHSTLWVPLPPQSNPSSTSSPGYSYSASSLQIRSGGDRRTSWGHTGHPQCQTHCPSASPCPGGLCCAGDITRQQPGERKYYITPNP